MRSDPLRSANRMVLNTEGLLMNLGIENEVLVWRGPGIRVRHRDCPFDQGMPKKK